MLKVLDVDGAVRRVRGGWESHRRSRGSTTPPGCARVAQARTAEQDSMREYVALDGCRMEFLRRCLDDPGAVAVRPVRRLRRAAVHGRRLARRA